MLPKSLTKCNNHDNSSYLRDNIDRRNFCECYWNGCFAFGPNNSWVICARNNFLFRPGGYENWGCFGWGGSRFCAKKWGDVDRKIFEINGRWNSPLSIPISDLCYYEGHSGNILSCAVSPDGSWILSGSEDNTLKIWDTKTTQCKFTLQGHTKPVWYCAISSNGELILSGGLDGIKMWRLKSKLASIILIQSTIRMYLLRKVYLEILSLKPGGTGYLKAKTEFSSFVN